MRFELNILGCGSATPSLRHNPSSQVVNYRDKLFIIDCGEGAQLQARRMRLKFSRLNHIFISHLHGDHCFGLPGLLASMSLHDKGGEVTVHINREGIEVLEPMIRHFCDNTSYKLTFVEIPQGRNKIYEDNSLIIESFPLYHRVPCSGFIFREKSMEPHLRKDMLERHNIPIAAYGAIKRGADFTSDDGNVIPNSDLVLPPTPSVSFAYCSDTCYDERVANSIKGVDVVYHEATYADDNLAKAIARGHSTARQAAMIAKAAGAKHLILGHYSKSYRDLSAHLAQAREVFGPNVTLADEGLNFNIRQMAAR